MQHNHSKLSSKPAFVEWMQYSNITVPCGALERLVKALSAHGDPEIGYTPGHLENRVAKSILLMIIDRLWTWNINDFRARCLVAPVVFQSTPVK